jgi:hypothetical protein
MTNNARVYNESRKFHMKHKQALKAIEACSAAWVEYGVSIRDLTIAEAVQARFKQAAESTPAPNAELPGLIFEQPASATASAFERYALIRDANALMVM